VSTRQYRVTIRGARPPDIVQRVSAAHAAAIAAADKESAPECRYHSKAPHEENPVQEAPRGEIVPKPAERAA
jgi:hypothetical protein